MGITRVIEVPSSDPLQGSAAAAVPDVGPQDGSRPAVLVVDDERLLRTLFQVGLEREGLRVFLAGTGEEACEFFRGHGHEISLVLLDVTMPGMSGFDTAAVLRGIDPDVQICFMTGDLDFAIQAGLVAEDAASVILKPFPLIRTARWLADMAHAKGHAAVA